LIEFSAGLAERNAHVPVTVGVILNQSLSDAVSITPETVFDMSDHVQDAVVVAPQSSVVTPG